MGRRVHPDLVIELSLWDRGMNSIAGVDEAGRGPLAGPVVAAAVIFPRAVSIEGVDDSKQLTEQKREHLFQLIQSSALSIGVGVVGHEVIDRINILQATTAAMTKAIESLALRPDFVLVDGNSFKHESWPYQNIVHGDARSFTIAAASIVAKVTRDRLMREYHLRFPRYGFASHKGYGTRQHLEAIRKHGLCEIHRRSFRIHGDDKRTR